MKYFSEKTNQVYDAVEDLEKAEQAYEKQRKALEDKKARREQRAKEVEKAFEEANEATKKANELLQEFIEDYGSFHTSLTKPIESIWDTFFKLF